MAPLFINTFYFVYEVKIKQIAFVTVQHYVHYIFFWRTLQLPFNPLDYCIWYILQDLAYKGRRLPFANLQDLKDAIKTNGRSQLRQLKINCTMEKRLNAVTNRMEARFRTFFNNGCDWISISCSEMC